MNAHVSIAQHQFKKFPTKASLVMSLSALLTACGMDENFETSDVPTTNVNNDPIAPLADAPNSEDNAPTSPPVKVSLIVDSGVNASVSETDINQLDIVFQVSASFDANVLQDNAVINLGLDDTGAEMASLGRADFDQLSAKNATLNIHATQQNIEVDYKKGLDGNLTINFENNEGAIVVGEDDFETSPNQAIQVFDAKTLNINHLTDQSATVQGTVLIDGFTEDIVVTTSEFGGDLAMIGAQLKPTFTDTGAIKTVTVNGLYGDLKLISFDPIHGDAHLLDDATKLQSIDISGHNSAIEVGSVGYLPTLLTAVVNPITLTTTYDPNGFVKDLETIDISLSGTASLHQHPISAFASDIAEVNIQTGAGNTVTTDFRKFFFTPFVDENVMIEALTAEAIEKMVVDTTNGGGILLKGQAYLVQDLTLVGSGEIIFVGVNNSQVADAAAGGNTGFRQAQAADASQHSGERFFYGLGGQDVIYGSDQDDIIVFAASNAFVSAPFFDIGDVYYDSGGNDDVNISAYHNVAIFDGDAGTDDSYSVNDPRFTLFNTAALDFHAGSGNDTITFGFSLPINPEMVSIDLGTWLNGMVDINDFQANNFKISLDGLPGITTTIVTSVGSGTILTHIDDNKAYLGFDGDQVVNGNSVANYNDLQDVASYLDTMVSNSSQSGDSAVFILENGTSTSANGDDADYYFYLFNESDGVAGISVDEIANFASLELATGFPPSGPLTVADFV